jgi:hypothetical protein
LDNSNRVLVPDDGDPAVSGSVSERANHRQSILVLPLNYRYFSAVKFPVDQHSVTIEPMSPQFVVHKQNRLAQIKMGKGMIRKPLLNETARTGNIEGLLHQRLLAIVKIAI